MGNGSQKSVNPVKSYSQDENDIEQNYFFYNKTHQNTTRVNHVQSSCWDVL